MDQLIELYFELGIKYANIVLLLNDKHDYEISESKHQLILTMRGLTKIKHYSDLQHTGREGTQKYCEGTQRELKNESHHDL